RQQLSHARLLDPGAQRQLLLGKLLSRPQHAENGEAGHAESERPESDVREPQQQPRRPVDEVARPFVLRPFSHHIPLHRVLYKIDRFLYIARMNPEGQARSEIAGPPSVAAPTDWLF